MINEIPYYLTNRNQGFRSPYIREDDYSPVRGDHMLFRAADDLRRLLKLDKQGSDWYWRPLHSLILHDKMFCSWFDTTSTVSPNSAIPVSPVFYNSRVSGTTNRPRMTWLPTELPDSFAFDFVLRDDGTANWTNGNSYGVTPVSIYQGLQVNPVLTTLLPGCDFGFITRTAPVEGTTFGVTLEPTAYPVASVLALCEASSSCSLLLAGYGMQTMYSAIPDDLFKLGMISALIARATKDHGK